MSERSIPKLQKKHIRGVLDFDSRCGGCGHRVNKATGEYCHECEGGHDVHTHTQAESLLHKRAGGDRRFDEIFPRKAKYEYTG